MRGNGGRKPGRTWPEYGPKDHEEEEKKKKMKKKNNTGHCDRVLSQYVCSLGPVVA
jgi:hypothetical protein